MRAEPSPFTWKLGVSTKNKVYSPFSQRAWSWAVVGAVMGGLTALLIHLPAQWLAQALFKATQGQVQLQEAKGSVWQGSGKLVLTGGEGSRDALALPGRIHWQTGMSLNSANLPQFNFNLNAPCCMTQSARLSLQAPERLQVWQLQVDDHQSQWPAHLLSGLGAPWNTLEPEGTLRLETKQLRFNLQTEPAWLQGGITLTAENMSSKLSTLKPMGTYQINLGGASAANPLPSLSLTTQSGSLLLSGQGQWQGSRLQFRGEASAVPEHAAALSNLLNIIGRRQGARSLLSLG
jgi:general secretion pathway protein N